nr:serine hydrolase domain-containing protein [Candidatus Sigynarchaeota archaeon]
MTDIASEIPAIECIINQELATSKAPGLEVGIVQDGRFVFGKGYGFARLDDKIPVTLDTVFRWGSISKPFTCIAFFQLWEQGKFNLDDSVNTYLKNGWIRKKHANWPDITFKHLLTHTSGIGEARRFSDVFYPSFRLLTYDDKPVPPMSTFHELPQYVQGPAGQKYAYSNIGGFIIGYIIELVSGESYQDYMIRHVLDPLGMHDSDFDRSDRVNQALSTGYKLKKGMLVPAKLWNNIIKPSGGLHASIGDMAKFVICLLNKGELNGNRLLKPDPIELIWNPHYWAHASFKNENSMGYIFRIGKLNGKRVAWHTGGLSGFTSTLDLIPDDNIGLYTVANLSET